MMLSKLLKKLDVIGLLAGTLLLAGCGQTTTSVNYESGACILNADLDQATKSSTPDAFDVMQNSHASLVAWLSAWRDEGVVDTKLHQLLLERTRTLGAFMYSGDPQDAKNWIDFEDTHTSELLAMCSKY